MAKVLITGGCGFVGHHVVEHFIKNTAWDITVIDKVPGVIDSNSTMGTIPTSSKAVQRKASIIETAITAPMPP